MDQQKKTATCRHAVCNLHKEPFSHDHRTILAATSQRALSTTATASCHISTQIHTCANAKELL